MLLTVMWLTLVAGGFTAGSSSGGASPLTTKGDIYTFTTVDARLATSTDGLCLKTLASTSTGLEWGTCAAGGSGLTYAETAAANLGGF
jgi:hypothetical protein